MPISPSLPDAASSLMLRLREGTADLHTKAEGHRFQTALVRGETPTIDYVRWLAQMLAVHETLENALVAERSVRPQWTSVVRDDLLQAPRLRDDLRLLGSDPASVAIVPAAATFRDRIVHMREHDAIALLGVLYVLEGSKNGNRFIARALRRRTAEDAPGFSYLDPHGEAQRPLWLEFKREMDALGVSPAESDAILGAARETFQAVTHISDDLTN